MKCFWLIDLKFLTRYETSVVKGHKVSFEGFPLQKETILILNDLASVHIDPVVFKGISLESDMRSFRDNVEETKHMDFF